MNEQQHPKEHCDHECVCGVLMIGGTEGDRSPCNFSGCKHDTRSRPHPAPAQCPKWVNDDCTATWGLIEEEAARKAREDVLKELQDYYSNLPEHEASCPFDMMNSDECQGMEGDCETCILNHVIEFLQGEHK